MRERSSDVIPTGPELPADLPRRAGAPERWERVPVALPEAPREERTALALGALAVLAGRLAGRDEIGLRIAVGGRAVAAGFDLAGDPPDGGDPPPDELVRRAREALDGATTRAMAEEDEGARHDLRLLFQADPGVPHGELVRHLAAVRAELGFDAGGEAGAGVLFYDPRIFFETTARRLAAALGRIAVRLAGGGGTESDPLDPYAVLSRVERHLARLGWNDRPGSGWSADGGLLHDGFLARARETPDAPALVAVADGEAAEGDPPVRWTYGELERRSARLAARLRALGVGPESRVGVALERTPDLVVALLGVLRAGGAYVPLDPAYPQERVAFMLEDSGAVALVAGEETAARLPAVGRADGPALVIPEGDPGGLPAAETPEATGPTGDPDRLAYVIYTSGSTGRPKGVAIAHRSAAAMVAWALGFFQPSELAATLAATSVSFDLSVFEIFATLAAGGCLVLVRDVLGLTDAAERAGVPPVTLVNTVPSAMTELLARDGVPPSVRTVNLAGEALPRSLVDAIHRETSATRVNNLYGPSEDTTYSTAGAIRPTKALLPGDPEAPEIGRPVDGTRAYLVDRRGRPVPPGTPGELWLAGPGVTRGYLGRPALTAERFKPDPFHPAPGGRVYITGDLARHLPDGRLAFLGRIDHQVKVRGFRIELGEIEAALSTHSRVAEAVVVARTPGAGSGGAGPLLVAYHAPATGKESADAADLRELLARTLPAHMLPSRFVALPALPRNPNGKVDRARLPDPEAAGAGPAGGPPREGIESELAGLWSETLEIEPAVIGREDHFFLLGGHSLVAARLLARLREGRGVELTMASLFRTPTLAGMAETVAEVENREAAAEAPALPPLAPADDPSPAPLSYAQQRLWLLDRMAPGLPVFNMPEAWDLDGPLDPARLAAALSGVVSRHEAWRTRLVEMEGGPRQVVAPPAPVPLPVIDLSELPEHLRGAETDRLTAEEGRRAFDLSAGPLVRSLLLRLRPGGHRWILNVHHVVSDAWSQGVAHREIAALYAGRPDGSTELPELPIQYPHFARWQHAWPDGYLEAQLAWWVDHLAGWRPLELPADHPRPARPTYRGTTVHFALPPEVAQRVEEEARRRGATEYLVLLAAFQALVSRICGQDDFVSGTPVANRGRTELEPLLGFFVNLLPLRAGTAAVAAGADPSFAALVERVRDTVLEGFERQDVPFERLVEELNPERHLGVNPICQAVFQLLDRPTPAPLLAGLRVAAAEVPDAATRVDLVLTITRTPDGLAGALECAADVFDPATPRALADRFALLLTGALEDPSRSVAELPVVTAAERRALLAQSPEPPGYEAPRPGGAVHRRALRRARETPDAIAVASPDGATLSYGALAAWSERLAAALRARGVGAGSRVGVCLARGPEMVAALLAVLRSGAAYLPLDLTNPVDRLAFMAEDSGAELLVTRGDRATALPASLPRLRLDLEQLPEASSTGSTSEAPVPPETLACVLYTSGSTGRPKGVGALHGALENLTAWHLARTGLAPGDRGPQIAQLGFDAASWEIWTALAAGATLVLVPEPARADPEILRDWLVRERLSVVFLTTPLAEAIVRLPWPEGSGRPALRLMMAGGERLHGPPPPGLPFDFFNVYGPTENGVITTEQEVPPAVEGPSPPIGRTLPGIGARVVDASVRLSPPGSLGELLIAGRSLARGYLGRPGLTAERFTPDPFSEEAGGEPGGRLYRTGDLVRLDTEGRIEFLGRIDGQVKLRGFRIELGEVEAALARHPAVEEVAVLAVAEGVDRQLVAVATPAQDARLPGPEELRRFLGRSLPPYMVPSRMVARPSLPRNPSGKIDRRRLVAELPPPEAGDGDRPGGASGRPLTPVEEIVAGIWSRVLEVDAPGPSDDFFGLGGHSLLAAQVISRVRDALGVDLPLQEIFASPTLEGLSAAVQERLEAVHRDVASAAPPLVALPRRGPMPLSYAQSRLWFLARFDPDDPTYNVPAAFRMVGDLDRGRLGRGLAAIEHRHETLRTRFVEGPDGPLQEVLPADGFRRLPEGPGPLLAVIDLSGLPPARRPAEAARLGRIEAQRPFDLASGRPWRASIVDLGGPPADPTRREHRFHVVLHHIASDGWSQAIFHRELVAHYSGRGDELPELPVQYADFAAWQRSWLDGDAIAGLVEHWRERLAGAPTVVEIPTDRPRPPERSYRGDALPVALPPELADGLRALARRRGVTLFMVLLAGFQALVARLTGRRDLLLGSVVAGRDRLETEPLIGFFVNALALRGDFSGDPTVEEMLGRARATALDAFAHRDIPFERLVDELQPARDLSHQPLIQVMFGLQNEPLPLPELPGVTAEHVDLSGGVARFDLTLALFDHGGLSRGGPGGGIDGIFEYSSDLYDRTTVGRLTAQLETLLAGAAAAPEARFSSLPLLAPGERHQVVSEWNDTRDDALVARAGACTLDRLFSERAALAPEALAVSWNGRKLSYGELDRRVSRLAFFLRERGVGRGTPVAVWMERSLHMAIAVLAVHRAGGYYLPIDSSWPPDRAETVLVRTGATVALVRTRRLEDVLDLRWRPPALRDVVCLDETGSPRPPAERIDTEDVRALFDYVSESAVDRVTAGGFVSAFTGEPFSEAEVDEYRDRVLGLAGPWLRPGARVLEVGCGSGLIFWEAVARTGGGVGIDPSPRTQEVNRRHAEREGLSGVTLLTGFAHELDALLPPDATEPFDLVIVASTAQFFPGPLYLEEVIAGLTRRLAPGGALVVADVPDARRRDELRRELEARLEGRPEADRAGDALGDLLFVDEELFTDFGRSAADLDRVEIHHRTEPGAGFDNELRYRYDAVLVAGEEHAGRTPDHGHDGAVRRRSRLWTGWHVARCPDRVPPPPTGPDDVAYVIFTSGSTGEPKGIVVRHRPAVQLVEWVNRTFAVGPDDRLLFVTSLSFDLSVYDLFGTLAAGATVRIASSEELEDPDLLVRALVEEPITIWDSAPAALQRLAPLFPKAAGAFPAAASSGAGGGRDHLRLVLLSGDWIPLPLPDRVREAFPRARVVSLGGATEATVWSNWFPVARVDAAWASVPYGRPIANARYHVFDGAFRPLPAGVPGDLYIGGDCLSVGYLGQPALTANSFLPDPFPIPPATPRSPSHSPRPAGLRVERPRALPGEGDGTPPPDPAQPIGGGRLYRTGDRARYGTDGNLEFLGRRDHQVKVRGFRIELGEIEVVLGGHPDIREVVVLALGASEPGVDRRLVAFVVPAAEGARADAGELGAFLRRSLPEYMVPSAFVSLDQVPATPNGKVDRGELERIWEERGPGSGPDGDDGETGRFVPPRTPAEELVAALYGELLGASRVGAHDSFFELGGHSLLATQAIGRLRDRFGVEIPLRTVFQAPTVEAMSRAVEALRSESALPGSGGEDAGPIPPVDRSGPLELSASQLRQWFLVELDRQAADYNLPVTLLLRGPLDPHLLARALEVVSARHETLRTGFRAEAGVPRPIIHEVPGTSELPRIDLSGLPEDARRTELVRRVHHDVARPFDLSRPPLFRAALVRLGEHDHALQATVHHIVFDGWSLGVLVEELGAAYAALAAGRAPELAPLPIQYVDYAAWQRRRLEGEAAARELALWREQLAGAAGGLELPTDRPRPAVQSYRGGAFDRRLPRCTVEAVRGLAAREGATLFMVLLATLDALLFRITGQDDLNVGTFVANRARREVEPLIGFFVNTLVLRTEVQPDGDFRRLLGRVRETTLAAYEHQDVPFERLLDREETERDLSRTPLFQVMLGVQNFSVPAVRAGDLAIESVDLYDAGRTNADLALWAFEEGEGLRLWLQYNGDLFDPTTARRLLGRFETVLAAGAAAPERALAELPILGRAERQQLLLEWNPAAETELDESLFDRPARLARERPEAVALEARDEHLTWAELDRRAGALAEGITRAAGGAWRAAATEPVVAVRLPRSPAGVVSLLAAWRLGAAYMPLDPEAPDERCLAMLADAGPGAVLLGEPVAGFGGPRIGRPEAPAGGGALEGPKDTGGDAIAYVLFTSGSTGRPRMVPVPRRPYARLAAAAARRYHVLPTDRVLQFAALTFDISLEEVALWLSSGATLVLREDEAAVSPGALLTSCAARRVTVLDLPTAYWHGVVDFLDRRRSPPPPAVRRVILGGEAALPERVADWRRLAGPGMRLLNTYGPTEATIVVTAADLSAAGSNGADERAVAIGRPLDHARVYLVDATGRPVATEAVGELRIGGDALARGYPGRPGATAAAWVPDPFGPEPGGRLYRTGDLARRRADGAYEFAGRIDDQLKVRGFRVEPGEVAAALAAYPGAGEAIVLARRGADGGEARLCAWVAVGEEPAVTAADLLSHARSRLPAFMVPHDLVLLPELPITAHGKVDRRALPEPGSAAEADDGWVPPDGPTEETLAVLWGELLGRERVGARDDFFDLGGHSLLAPRLMARIEEIFDLELPLPILFEAPTLRELALEIERQLLAEIEALSEEQAERLLDDEPEELWI